MKSKIGELFIIGFYGYSLPDWVKEFERSYGLGGVVLFDYYCQTGKYENNVESPQQVKKLCAEISELNSKPLIFVDQEGGLVRRLKDSKGFKYLPSAKDFNFYSRKNKIRVAKESLSELKELGFHYDFAPVIDIDYNPKNPDIGGVKRSYSADINEVRESALTFNKVAKEANIGLCLKHYPGLGGALTNSHQEITDISDTVTSEQVELFSELAPKLSGNALLISHGFVKQWDQENPVSMSAAAIGNLRMKLPKTLFISDDIQMQGLQKVMGSGDAFYKGLKAGLDMICIGNNLLNEEDKIEEIAKDLLAKIREKLLDPSQIKKSINKVKQRKKKFYGQI